MIFVTPASLSVATFCSANAWNTYSLPILRAGSPVQLSRGPRIAKSTPARRSSLGGDSAGVPARAATDAGPLEQLGRGLRGRPRALVKRGGAAHPVQVLWRRIAGLEDAHSELRRPVSPLRLRLAPGVGRALDVAQHRLGL